MYVDQQNVIVFSGVIQDTFLGSAVNILRHQKIRGKIRNDLHSIGWSCANDLLIRLGYIFDNTFTVTYTVKFYTVSKKHLRQSTESFTVLRQNHQMILLQSYCSRNRYSDDEYKGPIIHHGLLFFLLRCPWSRSEIFCKTKENRRHRETKYILLVVSALPGGWALVDNTLLAIRQYIDDNSSSWTNGSFFVPTLSPLQINKKQRDQ